VTILITGQFQQINADLVERARPTLAIIAHQRSLTPNAIEEGLRGLIGFGENWDGHGGAAIGRSTVDRAARFIATLYRFAEGYGLAIPTPAIHAAGDGSVGFSWGRASSDIEAHIPQSLDSNIYFLTYKDGEVNLLDGGETPHFEALALLRRFILSD